MTYQLTEYDELCCYTLTHPAPTFLHQHVVDAHAAQTADEQTKPIRLTFALVGLFLRVERRLTGREVQRIHMDLARRTKVFPVLSLPAARGAVTAADVMAAPAGPDRDAAIDAWCAAVWEAYAAHRGVIAGLLGRHGLG